MVEEELNVSRVRSSGERVELLGCLRSVLESLVFMRRSMIRLATNVFLGDEDAEPGDSAGSLDIVLFSSIFSFEKVAFACFKIHKQSPIAIMPISLSSVLSMSLSMSKRMRFSANLVA